MEFWDRLNELPAFSPGHENPHPPTPVATPMLGAREIEGAVRPAIEACVRAEFDLLRSEIRQSQELVLAKVLETADDLTTAQMELQRQLAGAFEQTQRWVLESRNLADETLDRIVQLDATSHADALAEITDALSELRPDPANARDQAMLAAVGEAAERTTDVWHEIGRLADAVEDARDRSLFRSDLGAMASELGERLATQLAALRSEMGQRDMAIETVVADAETRWDRRFDTMLGTLTPTTSPPVTQAPTTNSALSPIRTDIRMVRNEIAALRCAVDELRAAGERASSKPKSAGRLILAATAPAPRSADTGVSASVAKRAGARTTRPAAAAKPVTRKASPTKKPPAKAVKQTTAARPATKTATSRTVKAAPGSPAPGGRASGVRKARPTTPAR